MAPHSWRLGASCWYRNTGRAWKAEPVEALAPAAGTALAQRLEPAATQPLHGHGVLSRPCRVRALPQDDAGGLLPSRDRNFDASQRKM